VLVVIDDRPADLTFDGWLALLATDEPTDENAEAGSAIRKTRELGEH